MGSGRPSPGRLQSLPVESWIWLPACRSGLMAKRVGRPKKPGGEGKSVRIETELAQKARIVALRKNIPLSDYLSDTLRAKVLKDFAGVMKEAGGEGEE